jgi:hypothetical protein
MHEELIKIKKATFDIQDVIDSMEHGVIQGSVCPTCGRKIAVAGGTTNYHVSVDSVLVPLAKPQSCEACFFGPACGKEEPDSFFCEKIWEKIIDGNRQKD